MLEATKVPVCAIRAYFYGETSMSLLPEDKKELLKNDFNEKLVDPVKIVMFTQEVECRFCSDTRKLAQEIATLSDKLSVELYDFMDAAKARNMELIRFPLAVIARRIMA
jgi:hypothetical protein